VGIEISLCTQIINVPTNCVGNTVRNYTIRGRQ